MRRNAASKLNRPQRNQIVFRIRRHALARRARRDWSPGGRRGSLMGRWYVGDAFLKAVAVSPPAQEVAPSPEKITRNCGR